jgi:acyl-coenzyme A synthetase/AMP-(fatty) acid ligase/acyl carrier protein
VTRSPRDFYKLLSREDVTVLNQTPAAFYQIIQVEESGTTLPLALRYVIFGGEALNFANLRPWFARHGDQQPRLANMYGITETTVHVTYRLLSASDAASETRSLIGEPIPDLRLYLLDAEKRPVAIGKEGEIYVGGAGVARGYLNRPELNKERFVADPFTDLPGARMYKSGDLARFSDGGELEYLGRGDDQVKIRGFRIELGEIETALVRHPEIRQACVTARADAEGNKRLVAYYVAADSQAPHTRDLKDFLSAKLPAHMVPATFIPLAALPLNLNGKIDRAALPAPEATKSLGTPGEFASNLEKSIASVWMEVLRQGAIELDDNFFDLGGDSLSLVTAQTQLQKLLHRDIQIVDLFKFTTVRTLAKHLENEGTTSETFSAAQQQARKQREAFARRRISKGGLA